jgi:hypothetical protein
MKLSDVIHTPLRIKRIGEDFFQYPQIRTYSYNDLVATDWEIEKPIVQISLAKLSEALDVYEYDVQVVVDRTLGLHGVHKRWFAGEEKKAILNIVRKVAEHQ